MKKVLVAYYSISGTTRNLALKIADRLECDIHEIKVEPNTFPNEMNQIDETVKAQIASGNFPKLISEIADLNQYDTLIIGSPTWGGSPSTPVISFLKYIQNFKGKVFEFHTFMSEASHFLEQFVHYAGNLDVIGEFTSENKRISGLDDWLEEIKGI